MKIEKNSSLSLNQLKGALLTNEDGAEFRIHDFTVLLDNLSEVIVEIKEIDNEGNLDDEIIGLVFSSLKKWTIQIQGGN
tara:strand:+ start:2994 stop:3230 length:237 start_codon:yes stop_codon:yes gene_type:complete